VFDTIEIEGTVDGEPATDDELEGGAVPDLVAVPDITVVVDEQGRIVSINGEAVPEDDEMAADPFAGVAGITSGGIDKPFGPQFPDRPLAVGDTWSEQVTEPVPDTDQEMTSTITYTVTGMDTVDGHDVAVIGFTTATTGMEIDLSEMFQAMFDGFADMAGDDAEIPTIEFIIGVGDSSGAGTYWFDQEAGMVRKVEQAFTVPMTMRMAVSSSDGSGSVNVTMDIESSITATLREAGGTAG
jgi:hypothetical protein